MHISKKGATMNPEMTILQKTYQDSPIATILTDSTLLILWRNNASITQHPILALPGGLSTLLPTSISEKIKNSVKPLSLPFISDSSFSSHPVEGGFLVTLSLDNSVIRISDVKNPHISMPSIDSVLRDPLHNLFTSISSISRLADKTDNEGLRELSIEMNNNTYLLLRAEQNIKTYLTFLCSGHTSKAQTVDITDLMQQLSTATSIMLVPKKIELLYDICPERLAINADPSLIFEVLLHILSNACKYSAPENTVFITLSSVNNNAIIKISDNGVGIPDHIISKISDPFFSYTHENEYPMGIGLGLSISNLAITEMGGSIAFNSSKGNGTTVAIRLPLVPFGMDLNLSLSGTVKDNFRQRFSSLHIIMSDCCSPPTP